MARPSKYPEELRERAVRMVAEIRPDYPSQWAAISAVASKLGIGTPETVRTWIRRAEVDAGSRPGVTTEQAAEVARLQPWSTTRRASFRRDLGVSAALAWDTKTSWVGSGF